MPFEIPAGELDPAALDSGLSHPRKLLTRLRKGRINVQPAAAVGAADLLAGVHDLQHKTVRGVGQIRVLGGALRQRPAPRFLEYKPVHPSPDSRVACVPSA